MPGIFTEPDDLCIYMTEACNSNCIMCPMSLDSRRRGNTMSTQEWEKLKEIDPASVRHITITGGEPFLQFEDLARNIRVINERFPQTEVLLLTNGRALSIPRLFSEFAPLFTSRYTVAIPIHAPDAVKHDRITQAPGSFDQTLRAIHSLADTGAKIEIRIVGSRLNLGCLSDTFRMIANLSGRIDVINLIAMEMTGCAARNRGSLWVSYEQLCQEAEEGIRYAIHHGINVGLYNFPLCTIPRRLWPLMKRSITFSKVRYDTVCDTCVEKAACGGLFYSTYSLGLVKVKPLIGEKP